MRLPPPHCAASGPAPRRGGAQAVIPGRWRPLLLVAAVLAAVPLLSGNDYFLVLFNIMALNAIIVLGLNLLIGSTGQVSLGHAAFYGLGAYLSAIASTTWQWPIPCAFAFSLAVVAAVSYLLALPTLRLEGHYLVMATLGFNIIVGILFNQLEGITGGPSGFPGIPKLRIGPFPIASDRSFYYFIWALFLVLFALSRNLVSSRVGRALHAIHERDLTAQTLGIPAYRYKVITFVLSALLASLAGSCYAHYLSFVSPKTFDIFFSVQIVTMVVVGGMGSLWGGLAGTALLTGLPEVLHSFEDLHTLLYGLILMTVLVFCPQGLLPAIRSLRLFRRNPLFAGQGRSEPDAPALVHKADKPSALPQNFFALSDRSPAGAVEGRPLLSIRDVSLGFGGIQALQEVSLDVFAGGITALIGPNGAGKTTLLNVISGLVRPQEGQVLLQDKDLVGLPPFEIAAQGVGRTFQAVQVYHHATVLENVLLGFHIKGRAGFARGCLRTPFERREERFLRDQALSVLDEFDLAEKALLPARQLSLIEQKRLELARALALSPALLLLDEPVGGLNPRESDVLVGYTSHLCRQGMAVILVEHDMNVVMRLADSVVVLQYGRKLASGTPREIQQNPAVIAAYLGTRKH
ncbi:MAG: branched-chain amino acid ABC transporter ATP-binding protein/permease [Syntrophobacteraceae bacterium]|nr:branched-chain amino acid ABC transporter ATP-binding protein/permease [Desulfobacteraceae bacterium]